MNDYVGRRYRSEQLKPLGDKFRLLQWYFKRRRIPKNGKMETIVYHRVIEMNARSVKAGDFHTDKPEFQNLMKQRISS